MTMITCHRQAFKSFVSFQPSHPQTVLLLVTFLALKRLGIGHIITPAQAQRGGQLSRGI